MQRWLVPTAKREDSKMSRPHLHSISNTIFRVLYVRIDKIYEEGPFDWTQLHHEYNILEDFARLLREIYQTKQNETNDEIFSRRHEQARNTSGESCTERSDRFRADRNRLSKSRGALRNPSPPLCRLDRGKTRSRAAEARDKVRESVQAQPP